MAENHAVKHPVEAKPVKPVADTTAEDTKKKKEENAKQQEEITKKMSVIFEKYGGFGSIPMDSEYWGLKAQLQALQIDPIEPSAIDRLPPGDDAANVNTTTARFGRVPSDNWPPRRANTNWDGVCPDPLDLGFEMCAPDGAEAVKAAQDKKAAEDKATADKTKTEAEKELVKK